MSGNQKKIELIRELQNKMDSSSNLLNSEEKSVIRIILNEEEWNLLSDDDKQSHRNASIAISKKWASDDLEFLDFNYLEGVIITYEMINLILCKIDEIVENLSYDLLKLKAFLTIEKDFINEQRTIHMNRHLSKELFSNLSNKLNEKYPEFRLDKFFVLYSKMYEQWPNKPR